MKAATLEDVPAPVDLMAGFYAEAGYTLNREHAAGVRGMTVEAAPDNAPAQKVYRRLGFAESPNRQLLALALAAPSQEIDTNQGARETECLAVSPFQRNDPPPVSGSRRRSGRGSPA